MPYQNSLTIGPQTMKYEDLPSVVPTMGEKEGVADLAIVSGERLPQFLGRVLQLSPQRADSGLLCGT